MSKRVYLGTALTRYLFGIEGAKTIDMRTINNQPWYTAREICGLLGIENHSMAVHRERKTDPFTLKESEWRNESIHTGNYGKDNRLMVNNGGMLKLIYQAKTPAAEAIREKIENIPRHLFPPQWDEYFTWG